MHSVWILTHPLGAWVGVMSCLTASKAEAVSQGQPWLQLMVSPE